MNCTSASVNFSVTSRPNHRAQPSLRGRQWHNRDGTHTHRPQPLEKSDSARRSARPYNERLLRPPNQTGRVLIERVFRVARRFISFPSFQHVQTNGISGCVIQHQGQKVESTTLCNRCASSWKSAGRSRCCAIASLTSSSASSCRRKCLWTVQASQVAAAPRGLRSRRIAPAFLPSQLARRCPRGGMPASHFACYNFISLGP